VCGVWRGDENPIILKKGNCWETPKDIHPWGCQGRNHAIKQKEEEKVW
jgi:hypothetical protein